MLWSQLVPPRGRAPPPQYAAQPLPLSTPLWFLLFGTVVSRRAAAAPPTTVPAGRSGGLQSRRSVSLQVSRSSWCDPAGVKRPWLATSLQRLTASTLGGIDRGVGCDVSYPRLREVHHAPRPARPNRQRRSLPARGAGMRAQALRFCLLAALAALAFAQSNYSALLPPPLLLCICLPGPLSSCRLCVAPATCLLTGGWPAACAWLWLVQAVPLLVTSSRTATVEAGKSPAA